MKARIRFLSISLLICILLCPLQTALAVEPTSKPSTEAVLTAVQPLITAQSTYDEILNTEVVVCDVERDSQGRLFADCFLTLTMFPKASSPEDMPYVQGMLNAAKMDSLEACIRKAQSVHSEPVLALVNSYIDNLTECFRDSIDATFGVRLMLDANGVITSIHGLDDNGIFPIEDYYPKTADELFAEGWAYVNEHRNDPVPSENEIQVLQRYYWFDAASYARRYTSNATSYCPHGNAKQDKSKYNSAYTSYCHADCANYMSQAIKYAGISADSQWKAGSYAWINVGGLVDYLKAKSYISACSFSQLKSGSLIVCNTSESPRNHIVMCTYKDSTKQLLSAHTTDRLNYSFTSSYGGSSLYYNFSNAVSGSQYGGNPST